MFCVVDENVTDPWPNKMSSRNTKDTFKESERLVYICALFKTSMMLADTLCMIQYVYMMHYSGI